MGGMFWASYGVLAGLALGLGAASIGLFVAQVRLDAKTLKYARSRGYRPDQR